MAEAIFPPNSVWCPNSKLQLSTVQQPCFLGHVFLRTYFFLDQSWNHPLCEPGVWLCPLATTGHFRTHCRKSSIYTQASVSGQGFCSSAYLMGGLTSSTKLETSTCVWCQLNRRGKPQQCTTGTRERSPARRGKGNKVKINTWARSRVSFQVWQA